MKCFFVLVLVFGNNSYLTQLVQTANTQHKPYSEGALLAFWRDSRFSLFNILFSFFAESVFFYRLCFLHLALVPLFLTSEAYQRILRALPQSSVFSSERVVVGNFELKLLFFYSFFPFF